MLPFPIISNTHIILKVSIVKYVGANGYYLALSNTGNVYSYGTNSNGQLGLGDTTQRTTWTLSATGVDDIYLNRNSNTYTSIIRKGKKLLYSGKRGAIIGDSSVSTQVLTWTEFYDLSTLTSDGSTVTDIQSSTGSIGVLLSNKNLYLTGTNLGTGSTAISPVLTLSSSNVDSFSINSTNTYIVRGSELFGTGSNAQLQISNSGTSFSTYTSITTSVSFALGGINNVYIVLLNGEIWGRGQNALISLGLSGSTGNRGLTKLMNTLILLPAKIHCWGYGASVIGSDGIWGCGQTLYSGSSSSNQTVWTKYYPITSFSGSLIDLTGTNTSTVLHTSTGIYGAGSDLLVNQGTSISYYKLEQPK
ncbi:hypothetical protein pEaSNUABM49_00587 [Erwinia phage pEa_SNUABM_49]|nr:hypothetical protein pEaSNUABM49_00587 [Erwinia phage pEa_SNUABM_49]